MGGGLGRGSGYDLRMSDPRLFLQGLRAEVAAHPAVGHSLLARWRLDPRERADFKVFGGQHYALVGTFTRYLEVLLLRAPDSESKMWLAKVLVDEYGERSEGHDHAAMYRVFLKACGWADGAWEDNPLHPAVSGFVAEHLRICCEEPFLVGLGAVGPGHEWAIPAMFAEIIQGLRRGGFAESEIAYFTCHTEQDVDHANWLEEALAQLASSDDQQAQIRHGCQLSLAARETLWWGIADVLNAERMRQRLPFATGSTVGGPPRRTLKQLQRGVRVSLDLDGTGAAS